MKFLKIFLSVFASAVILLVSNTAFAYNAEYLDPARWLNKDVASHSINQKGMYGTLKGKCSYYVDNDDMCFYINLSIEEGNIETNDDVKIGFIVNSGKESYEFNVDANGDITSFVDVSDKFVAYSNFETNTLNNGTYIVALCIKDASKPSYISTYVLTKGKYVIDSLSDIEVKKAEKITQTTAIKTTKKSTKQTTKQTTTKKAVKNKSKQASTKYYNQNPTSPNVQQGIEDEDIIEPNSTTIVDNTPNVSKMYSSSYTIGIVAASVLFTIGFMLFLFGLLARKSKDKDNDE